MATSKSPFLIIPEFLSVKQCEEIIDRVGFITEPDKDNNGNPLVMYKHDESVEELVFNKLNPIIPEITSYYGFEYKGTEEIMLEYRDMGVTGTPICENSSFLRKKWVMTNTRAVSFVIFLTDYNNNSDFDTDYECYGGKLEFLQHNFGFNPVRGTMVIYPSGPHFINAFSEIKFGESYVIKSHINSKTPYVYQPNKFPGDYTTWFN